VIRLKKLKSIKKNQVIKFQVNEFLFQYTGKSQIYKNLNIKKKEKVYRISLAQGDRPSYIITNKTLKLGDNASPLEFSKLPYNSYLSGITKIKQKNWNNSLKNRVFRIGNLMSDQEFKKIKSLTADELNELIDTYIKEKFKVDDRLLLLIKALLIRVPPESPNNIHRFSPNASVFTTSGSGKTKMFGRVGDVYVRSSIARMLGFSTADSTAPSELNENNIPKIFDEVSETKDKNLCAKLMQFMEEGKSEIAVGIKNVMTEGRSPLIFCSNPQEELHDSALYENFLELLDKVTTNYVAFGRRMAIILFGSDYKKAIGRTIPSKEHEELEQIIKEISNRLEFIFLEIINKKDVKKYLEAPNPDWFIKKTKDLIYKAEYPELKNIIRGFQHNHTHSKGLAIRIAVIDNLKHILNNKINTKDLIQATKDSHKIILEIICDDMLKIIDTAKRDKSLNRRITLKNLYPLSLRALIHVLIEKIRQEQNIPRHIPFEQLKPYLQAIPPECKPTYTHISPIIRRLKTIDNTQLTKFGIKIDKEFKLIEVTSKKDLDFWIPKPKMEEKIEKIMKIKGKFITDQDLKKHLTDKEIESAENDYLIIKQPDGKLWELCL